MKNLITLIAILFVSSTYAQTAMTRTIDVKDGQMAKFIEMAGKKTKKYDGPEAATQFYTWNILSGPNAGKIITLLVLLCGKEQIMLHGLLMNLLVI